MKRSTVGLLACLLCVLLATIATAANYEKKEARVHQHLQIVEKEPCDHEAGLLCTHLPLLEINTGGQQIPGEYATEDWSELTTTQDGEKRLRVSLEITDNAATNNHPSDVPTLVSEALINVRGRSSRTFDKQGYRITLINGDGTNNDQVMMGMDAHHEWVLHGPFLDKTLIRNYMWYNIAGEIMDYAPNVRLCEVILDGEYWGVYLLTERITAGDDGARLNLSVDKKGNEFSGYLLRLDQGSATPIKNIETFSMYTYRFPQMVNIVYPGAQNLTEEMAESIRQDFSAFEKALYSFDYNDDEFGYQKLIDVESFVDYLIINEFTLNYDAGWLSTFVYKEMDGLLRMCIWDFNSACDNYQQSNMHPNGFQFQNCVWYFMLMKDEAFVEAVIDRYKDLRERYLSDEYLLGYIDETVAYLGDAVDRNFDKWGYTFEEEYDMLIPESRNPRTFEEAIANLKSAITVRGEWMDENIHTLRQYAAESKVKKFNEHTD